jgi:hypothetical protein
MEPTPKMLHQLNNLGTPLSIVQAELNGNRHYKDVSGNRLILFPDGTFTVECVQKDGVTQ